MLPISQYQIIDSSIEKLESSLGALNYFLNNSHPLLDVVERELINESVIKLQEALKLLRSGRAKKTCK